MKQRFYKFDTFEDYSNGSRTVPSVSLVKEDASVWYDFLQAVNRPINPELMDICVAKGWAKESTEYLTFEEANDVASLNINNNNTIKSLNELKYFTGVVKIDNFNNLTALESIVFPPNASNYIYNPMSKTFVGCSKLDKIDLSLLSWNPLCTQFLKENKSFRQLILNESISSIPLDTFTSTASAQTRVKSMKIPYNGILTVTGGNNNNKEALSICRFYVPDDLVEDYKTDASTKYSGAAWSTVASRIFPISQWDIDFPKNPVQMPIADPVTANVLNNVIDKRTSNDGVFTEEDAKMVYNSLLDGIKNVGSFWEFHKFTRITNFDRAFQGTTTLTELKCPNSLIFIGLFGSGGTDNNSIKKLVFGSNVTSMSTQAFARLKKLQYIVFKSVNPPTCTNNSFFYYTNIPKIYVPDASVEAYKTAQYWTAAASKITPLSQFATDFPDDDISLEGEE